MNPIVCVLIVAGVLSEVAAQETTTYRPGDNKCLEDLKSCTEEYGDDDKNGRKLNGYHDCVEGVLCLKHGNGYNDRLELLDNIDQKLESLKADQENWWDSGASCLKQSIITNFFCLVVAFKIFFANIE